MSRNNYLRFGIILTVTGIIALTHYFFAKGGGILPSGVELAVAIVLIVAGVPLLVVALRR